MSDNPLLVSPHPIFDRMRALHPLILAAIFPFGSASAFAADNPTDADLARGFQQTVRPFVESYCVSCHGGKEPEAEFDLTRFNTLPSVVAGFEHWQLVLERLSAEEMPTEKAKKFPTAKEREAVVGWIQSMRQNELRKHAGDPGPVLARRLSNSEYDYSIRDLTGRDLQPTKEFPVDPSNTAGFDNSGESLAVSPALLDKYLKAARAVADHLYLQVEGFSFAPHPMLVETDRDRFCVQQIVDFYHQQNTDYADYFQAAWRFKHRAALGRPRATLADFAVSDKVSPKYLAMIWSLLEGIKEEIGPTATLQAKWRQLPAPAGAQPDVARTACEALRDYVVQVRKKVEMRFLNITAGRLGTSVQPLLMWKNVQYATHRRKFDPAQLQVEGEPPLPPPPVEAGAGNAFGPGKTVLVVNSPGDPDLAVPAGQRARYEAAFAKFCAVFPDMFYKQERGRNYFDTKGDRGRYLSAGYHNVMGYFRDDQALYELLLDEKQQKKLDRMWGEMDFVASVASRTYVQFAHNPDRPAIADTDVAPDGAPPVMLTEDKQITAQDRIMALKADFLNQASTTPPPGGGRRGGRGAAAAQTGATQIPPALATPAPPAYVNQTTTAQATPGTATQAAPAAAPAAAGRGTGGRGAFDSPVTPEGIQAVKDYFDAMNTALRWVEKARVDAEPSHLQALFDFAARAYRRALTKEDRDEILAYYKTGREKDGLDHESAIRDSIVALLMSPDFFYRIDLVGGSQNITPLSDTDLASRLSYFLWSSIPDQELMMHAAKGDLHNPKVMAAQARRMLADSRVRALAVEFGGNWLDFRRFESLSTVDRGRFAGFTNELRTAMFEEPVRFLTDVFQRNRPVLDLLYARDTFVNPVLAKHYGIPVAEGTLPTDWVRVEDATTAQRGGLLPMAVFLTKNAPGLRTSPVKRGNWVVKNILGERIPPPPPNVPTLAQDETKLDLPLRDMLARHRQDAACATCHERFDSLGLVFEGFGPTGERRETDLANRPVDARASFPRGGGEGTGLTGLQQYIRNHRQDDFVTNFCSKLVAYALGRSLIPSDDELIAAMRTKLATDGGRIDRAIETLVTSPQFLRKRARNDYAGN